LRLVQSNIKKLIENKAVELGFVKIGFTKADVLHKESDKLKQWLDKGYDADMSWIKKGFDKRKDVKLIMKDAKTVISLSYNYYTSFQHDENNPKISRYAWGKDYHNILKKKLKGLCGYIETALYCEEQSDEAIPAMESGIASSQNSGLAIFKYYVDDGPVMDKVWAARAGIGWMGKHTNIINPEYGSWIFLSEIITNLEFETYNSPIEDLCGSCRICIDACPTGAIIDEYVLDANLCISYQTIENRGDIPDYIDTSGWVFGCDVCQDVCPFNKNDKPTKDKNFYPALNKSPFKKVEERSARLRNGQGGGFPTKAELEAITEEEFMKIFSDSPVKRTKFKGWKRNLKNLL
jgi:epoxyqueuosine reductase